MIRLTEALSTKPSALTQELTSHATAKLHRCFIAIADSLRFQPPLNNIVKLFSPFPCLLPTLRAARHFSALLVLGVLGVMADAHGQSFSIRYFGPTNSSNHPITGFNNRTEMVGVLGDGFISGGDLIDAAWVWLLEPKFGLPSGYSSALPPSDGTHGDRSMFFVGIDEGSRITANLSGEGISDPNLPPGAWLGSVVRWSGGSLQFIAGFAKPKEPAIGDIWPQFARAYVSGGPGIAAGLIGYRVITNLGYCTTCSPPVVNSIATSAERRRWAIFDMANGGYRFLEPEDASITFSSINRLGTIVGLYQRGDGVIHAGLWNWTGSLQEFAPPGAPPGMYPLSINDRGEIAGTFNTNGHTTYSSSNTVGVFLYLPQSAYGLPSGFTIITNGGYSGSAMINNSGLILFQHMPTPDLSVSYLWNRGRVNTLQSLLPSTSGWSNVFGAALNDRGAVVGYGQGPYGEANFLARPWIYIDITASTNRVRPGEEFLVYVNFTNRLTTDLISLNMLGALGMNPSNLAQVVSGPEPAPPITLAGEAGTRFTFRVLATNNGPVTFTAQVRGTNSATGTRHTSFIAQSDPVLIADAADLLVKQSSEPESAYILDDRYFSSASDYQLVTAQVQTNKPAEFDVRVENDSGLSRTLRLAGTLVGSTNWSNSITLGNQDVTAQVLSAGGLTFTDVEGKGRRQLRVKMALKPNATSQEDQRLRLSLYSDAVPDAVMDLAELRGLQTSIPVVTYLAKLTRNGLTPESIDAGLTDIDAPLIPVANSFLLSEQPLVSAGLVADGVTPLLINMSADRAKLAGIQDGRKYRIELSVLDGAIAGESLQARLKTLSGSSWISSNVVVMTGNQPEAYAYLPGIPADDISVSSSTKEVKVSLKVIEVDTGLEVGSKKFAIRQPPLFLIHGYNTKGDWGPDAIAEFSRTRENGTFLQVIRYGQNLYHDANLLSSVAGSDMENTYYTLRDLTSQALLAYNYAKRKLEPFWAFTRHDVAAHSQGGLLTRMLASETANPWMPQPYRNRENLNRGRFHRVVTIGSPHNGTRLLRYLLRLNQNFEASVPENLWALNDWMPGFIGAFMVGSGIAQEKFDPWGPQIQELNDPSPGALWRPDPAARFHMVRATINGGLPPTALSATPSEVFLGLVHANQPVIPAGSDGVVDWHSMAAQSLDGPPPVNSFTMSPELLISHSGPLPLFVAPSGETDSLEVAEHVHAALTQDPALPPSQRQFGPFPVPPLLPTSIRDAIDAWATNVAILDFLTQAPAQLQAASGSGSQTFLVTLDLPPGLNLSQPPGWFAEVFGTNGVTSAGVTIEVVSNSLNQARVTIDSSVVGDVVIKCGFRGTNGVQYVARAQRLLRREPAGQSLVSLTAGLDDTQLPVGTTVPLILAGTYADGQSRVLYPLTNEVTAASDNLAVVTTANPLRWRITGVGTAHVTIQYANLSTTVTVTGFLRDQPYRVPLTITQSGTNQVNLSWPATAPGVLQKARLLSSTNWSEVSSSGVLTGSLRQVTLPRTNATEFFRVQP